MIFNVTGGGAGSGGTLVVTAPAGVTCTVSKDGKTKTKTVDQYGYATFKGLDTGTWTVTISDGSETATATVEIVADYAKTMTFFAATITVTFPEGSTCTCSDGNTTLTAPTTSGSYTFAVPNAGDWTVSCTNGSYTGSTTVTITNGESQSVELRYYLYSPGDEHTENGGNWVTAAKNISSDGSGANALTLTLDAAGMTLAQTGSAKGGICYKANPIDLTDASTIVVKADVGDAVSMDNRRSINVWSSIGDYIISNQAAYSYFGLKSGKIEVELDVSSLTGEYVVGFGLYNKQSILVTEVVIS